MAHTARLYIRFSPENHLPGRHQPMYERHPLSRGGSNEQRESREWKFLHHGVGEWDKICQPR
jgi:hypothetical protein